MNLSIIIPALNEAPILGEALHRLEDKTAEIIVVDGGSQDATVEIARRHTPHVFVSAKGRGCQQDIGAHQARGNVLLFLHADTRLPPGFLSLVSQALADSKVVFGAFSLAIHPSSPALKLVASVANLRSRFFKLPYGDQAVFVRREAYFQVGGFRDWPVMEDVDLVRRLRRAGGFRLARGEVQTSARRWEQGKVVMTTLRNWLRMIRFFLGVSPNVLARSYPDTR